MNAQLQANFFKRQSQQFDPEMAWRLSLLEFVLNYYGIAFPQVNSGYRSPQDQLRLYNEYLDGTQRIKPASQSWHTVGRAVDINIPQNALPLAVSVWKYMGGRWGGDFSSPDPVHFDLPGPVAPPKIY